MADRTHRYFVQKALLYLCATGVLAFPSASHAFQVRGAVTNGTTGKPQIPATVVVLDPARGMAPIKQVETMDGEGRFVIDGLDAHTSIYLLQVEYKGVIYRETVRFTGRDPHPADVKVFDTTTSWERVHVSIPHLMITRSRDTLTVDKVFQISNHTSPPRTVYGEKARFTVYVPEDKIRFKGFFAQSLGVPVPLTPEPTGEPGFYTVDYPIKPGPTRISASFDVPYTNGEYEYTEKLKYPIDDLMILSEDPTIRVSSETTALTREDNVHGFTLYRASSLDMSSPLTLTFQGGRITSTASNMPQVIVVPNRLENASLLALVFLALILVGLLGFAVSQPDTPEARNAFLRARKEELIKQISRLDDLHATGAISDEIYRLQRRDLVGGLSRVFLHLKRDEGRRQSELKEPKGAARAT